MNFLSKLEKRFGKFYIKNLMLIIILGNIFVYLYTMLNGDSLIKLLLLDSNKILQGEVWRFITFIFIPPSTSPLFLIFTLYFYYLAGSSLEDVWGEFRFNIYYLVGIIASLVAAFITEVPIDGHYINLSLFLAFAKLFPDFELLIFFIIPVKIKYLGILNWIFIFLNFIEASSFVERILVIIPLLNYFIFFGKSIGRDSKSTIINYNRKQKFVSNIKEKKYNHKCAVCGITDKDDDKMEFRYCSKCKGQKCYCMNHLKDHIHL